jgi:hypothetical protein
MAGLVDPEPIIKARLAELAAEHEPVISGLEEQLALAVPDDVRRLRRELRAARRAYATERRRITRALTGGTVLW